MSDRTRSILRAVRSPAQRSLVAVAARTARRKLPVGTLGNKSKSLSVKRRKKAHLGQKSGSSSTNEGNDSSSDNEQNSYELSVTSPNQTSSESDMSIWCRPIGSDTDSTSSEKPPPGAVNSNSSVIEPVSSGNINFSIQTKLLPNTSEMEIGESILSADHASEAKENGAQSISTESDSSKSTGTAEISNNAVRNMSSGKSTNSTQAPIPQMTPETQKSPLISSILESTENTENSNNAVQNMSSGKGINSTQAPIPPMTPETQKSPLTSSTISPRNISSEDISSMKKLFVLTATGRSLLQYFDKNKCLTYEKRKEVTKIVIDFELAEDQSKRIAPERFCFLAEVICRIFTSENPYTFYVPYIVTQGGMKQRARGKLYERYNYVRKKLKKDGVITKRLGCPVNDLSSDDDDDDDDVAKDPEQLEADRRWLESNTEPWTETIQKFKLTLKVRLGHFRRLNLKICEYFLLYPAFLQPHGYTLIDIDFDTLYPQKRDALFSTWGDLQDKLLALGKRKASQEHYGPIFSSLGIDFTLEDIKAKTINSLLLLPALLPNITVKRNWRLTKLESKEGFILTAADEVEAETKYNERTKKLENKEFFPQPVVLLVGPNLSESKIYIRLLTKKLEFSSVLKAVDTCFKMFMVLKEPFPIDSPLPWAFLEEFIYHSNKNLKLKYPHLLTLYNEVMNQEE